MILKKWTEENGDNTDLKQMTLNNPSISHSETFYTIAEAIHIRLGANQTQKKTTDFFQVSASISSHYHTGSTPWYLASPEEDDHYAKVDSLGNNEYYCAKTEQTHDSYKVRLILNASLADGTGSISVTCFNNVCETLFGVSGGTLESIYKNNIKKYQKLLDAILFKKYLFKIKCFEETYNEEVRIKYTVIAIEASNPFI